MIKFIAGVIVLWAVMLHFVLYRGPVEQTAAAEAKSPTCGVVVSGKWYSTQH